jgi:hypothetical protein
MDYLRAFNARGFLHASTCDSPAGYGVEFTRLMEQQGCAVRRYSAEAGRALHVAPTVGRKAAQQPPPMPDRIEKSLFSTACPAAENELMELGHFWAEFRNRAQALAVLVSARRQCASHVVFGRPLGSNAQWYAQARQHQQEDAQRRQAESAARAEGERLGAIAREARAARHAALPALGESVKLPSGTVGVVIAILTFQDWEKAALVRGAKGEGLARPGHWEAAAPAVQPRASPDWVPLPRGPAFMPSLFAPSSLPETP